MFYRSGCNLIVTGTNQDKLDKFVASLPEVDGAGQVFAYTLDLRDRPATEAFVQRTVDECPPIDILINNVSLILMHRFVDRGHAGADCPRL